MKVLGPAIACVAVASLALGACGDNGGPGPGPDPAAVTRLDLRTATGLAEVKAVGVTVDSDGNRFFFDEQAGLYRLERDGRATLVRALAELPATDVPVQPPFTDLVAVGPGRFAITAIGDGFLLDTVADTMLQYFCYVPDGLPDDLVQRTDALAYDPVTARIYAQPRTYDLAEVLQYTQIAGYDRATGLDVAWYTTPNELASGGMVIVPSMGMVVGDGSRLLSYDLELQTLTFISDLAAAGLDTIEGLAFDDAADSILVLDGPNQELVEVPVSRL